MNAKACVKRFLREFPEYKEKYDDHILTNGTLHVHVFFGEINSLFIRTRLDEPEKAKAYFDLIEMMDNEGDWDVREIVRDTILERFYNEPEVWEAFTKTASPEFVRTAEELMKGKNEE